MQQNKHLCTVCKKRTMTTAEGLCEVCYIELIGRTRKLYSEKVDNSLWSEKVEGFWEFYNKNHKKIIKELESKG